MRLSDPPVSLSSVGKGRRSQRRYAVELELHCKLVGSGESFLGKTSDMSSKGVRFHAPRTFPIGATLELCIKWPTPVTETFPLNLLLEGRVIRCDGNVIAIQTHCYAFGSRKMTP